MGTSASIMNHLSKYSNSSSVSSSGSHLLCEHLRRQVITKEHFIFHSQIGEGGFGKVVSAMLVSTKQWVAIKCINKFDLLKHKTGADMLFGEICALSRLSHTYIAGIKFSFQDSRTAFMVLSLKSGGDLRFYLRKKVIFTENDVTFIVACLVSALEYVHSKNVIHRDVKPENIILDDRGYPHLADFGVAYAHTRTSGQSHLTCNLASGTKQYLAPEVFMKSHVHGPESDYWSLAVVAFELLYLKRPFEKHVPTNMIHYLEECYQLQLQSTTELPVHICSSSTINGLPNCHTFESHTNLSTLSADVGGYTAFSTTSSGSIGKGASSSALSPCSSGVTSPDKSSVSSGKSSLSPNSSFDDSVLNGSFTEAKSPGNSSNFSSSSSSSSSGATSTTRNKERIDQQREIVVDRINFPHYFVADHWKVEQKELTPALVVVIPKNPLNLLFTKECYSFLEKAFDIRPSHRLGCRNIEALLHHPWFAGINWRDIENKNALPHFVPGGRLVIDTSEQINQLATYLRKEEEFEKANIEVITAEQEMCFRDFDFISPEYEPWYGSLRQQQHNQHNYRESMKHQLTSHYGSHDTCSKEVSFISSLKSQLSPSYRQASAAKLEHSQHSVSGNQASMGGYLKVPIALPTIVASKQVGGESSQQEVPGYHLMPLNHSSGGGSGSTSLGSSAAYESPGSSKSPYFSPGARVNSNTSSSSLKAHSDNSPVVVSPYGKLGSSNTLMNWLTKKNPLRSISGSTPSSSPQQQQQQQQQHQSSSQSQFSPGGMGFANLSGLTGRSTPTASRSIMGPVGVGGSGQTIVENVAPGNRGAIFGGSKSPEASQQQQQQQQGNNKLFSSSSSSSPSSSPSPSGIGLGLGQSSSSTAVVKPQALKSRFFGSSNSNARHNL